MVNKLILVSAVPGGFPWQGEPPQKLMQMFEAVHQNDYERASELQLQLWVDGPFRESSQVDRSLREKIKKMNLIQLINQTWKKTDSQPHESLTPSAYERIQEIHIPVLIIAGELDDPEVIRAVQWMQNRIPDAQKEIMRDCAHLPGMEKPEEFNRIILGFLQ